MSFIIKASYTSLICSLLLLNACSTYLTPGGGVNLQIFDKPSIQKSFAAKATLSFPANLVLARVQESGYRNERSEAYGSGRYSVVTVREIETDDQLARISKLAGIAEVGTLNRLLLPPSLESDSALREAAARLRADLLLLYTIETSFRDHDAVPPLTLLTLGFWPSARYKVTSTASALLMDVKTGFIYGTIEESDSHKGVTIAWDSNSRMEKARLKTEGEALSKLLTSFESLWARVYARYQKH